MRWFAVLALVSCATTAEPSYQTRVYGQRAAAILPVAIEAARADRFDVALVQGEPVRGMKSPVENAEQVSFVALPLEQVTGAAIKVVFLLHVIGQPGRNTAAVTIAVTPVGYRGDVQVPSSELPANTGQRAQELLSAIFERVRQTRNFGSF